MFFWIVKIKYFTFFLLPKFHFFNIYGTEIIGTILIFVAIIIIHRVYPFPHSFIAIILCFIILTLNILNFFLFKNKIFANIEQYTPFITSLMLILISKLMENGLRYFGDIELSKKWRYFSIIILYGFSIPLYTFFSLNVCGFIKYDSFLFNPKIIILFLPLIVTMIYLLIYFLITLILSFKFLLKIQEEK